MFAYEKIYHSIHGGKCYAIRYLLYSDTLNSASFGPELGVDEHTLVDQSVTALLEEMVLSIQFTSPGQADDEKRRTEQYESEIRAMGLSQDESSSGYTQDVVSTMPIDELSSYDSVMSEQLEQAYDPSASRLAETLASYKKMAQQYGLQFSDASAGEYVNSVIQWNDSGVFDQNVVSLFTAKLPKTIGDFTLLPAGTKYRPGCTELMRDIGGDEFFMLCKSSIGVLYRHNTNKGEAVSVAFIEPQSSATLAKIKEVYFDGYSKLSITGSKLYNIKPIDGKYSAMVVASVFIYSDTEPKLDDMNFLKPNEPVLEYFVQKYPPI
jgi:hypothetical protein